MLFKPLSLSNKNERKIKKNIYEQYKTQNNLSISKTLLLNMAVCFVCNATCGGIGTVVCGRCYGPFFGKDLGLTGSPSNKKEKKKEKVGNTKVKKTIKKKKAKPKKKT